VPPRKYKVVNDSTPRSSQPKTVKSTQPKQRKSGKAIKAKLSRPPTAEMHRRVLMQSPVPVPVVVDWASRMADNPEIDPSAVEHHLSQVCTSANFGEWAHAFGRNGSAPSWTYVKRGMRDAYAEASWEQKIDGIFVSLGCSLTSESIARSGDTGARLTETDMERLVDAIVTYHSDKIRGGDRLKSGQRALSFLGLVGVSQLLARRITAWKREFVDTAETPDTPPETAVRSTIAAFAAIVVRSSECRDLERYLAESRAVSLTSETLYLASALTYQPKWMLLFESPVRLRLGRETLVTEFVSGTLGDEWVDVRFHPGASLAGKSPARIPVRPGRRTFDPTMVEHAALVLLDLLFSREESLRPSQAVGDRELVESRLAATRNTVSAVYRLSDRPRWDSAERTVGRLELKHASSRQAHDVRGHFRSRNGVSHPVKPHRRRS